MKTNESNKSIAIAMDKNGKKITILDYVILPDPNETDIYIHSFRGVVIDILNDGNIIVEDQDQDCYTIEANRVELEE